MKKYIVLLAILLLATIDLNGQIFKKIKEKIEDTKEKIEKRKKRNSNSGHSDTADEFLNHSEISEYEANFQNEFLQNFKYYTLYDKLIAYENVGVSYKNPEIIQLVQKSNERVANLKLLAEKLNPSFDFESAVKNYSPQLLNTLRSELNKNYTNYFLNGSVSRGFYWGTELTNEFEQRRVYNDFLESGIIEAIRGVVASLSESFVVISAEEFPMAYDFNRKRIVLNANIPGKRDKYFYSWELDEARAEEILQSIGGKLVYRIIDDSTPFMEGDELWRFYRDPQLTLELLNFETPDLLTKYEFTNKEGHKQVEEVKIIPRKFDISKIEYALDFFHESLSSNNLLDFYNKSSLDNEIAEYLYFQLRSPTEILGPIEAKLETACEQEDRLFLTRDYGLILSEMYNDLKNKRFNQGGSLAALDSLSSCNLIQELREGSYTEYFLKLDSRLVDSFFKYHDYTSDIYREDEIYKYNYKKGEQFFLTSRSEKSKEDYATCYAKAVTKNTMNSRLLWNALNGNQNAQIAGFCR